jgi:hypothetical protein
MEGWPELSNPWYDSGCPNLYRHRRSPAKPTPRDYTTAFDICQGVHRALCWPNILVRFGVGRASSANLARMCISDGTSSWYSGRRLWAVENWHVRCDSGCPGKREGCDLDEPQSREDDDYPRKAGIGLIGRFQIEEFHMLYKQNAPKPAEIAQWLRHRSCDPGPVFRPLSPQETVERPLYWPGA